jgi:hypothetical protein
MTFTGMFAAAGCETTLDLIAAPCDWVETQALAVMGMANTEKAAPEMQRRRGVC